MKKILAFVFTVMITLSLTGCEGKPKASPIMTSREDGVIELASYGSYGNRKMRFITVDNDGFIYFDNVDVVCRIDLYNRIEVFVDGLDFCRGVTAVNDMIYVFDTREGPHEELYMLRYNLQGLLIDETVIPLHDDFPDIGYYDCFVFREVPFVCIRVAFTDFYLYNIETGTLNPLDMGEEEDDEEDEEDEKPKIAGFHIQMYPLADKRLIQMPVRDFSENTVDGGFILTLDENGNVKKTDFNPDWPHVTFIVHDLYGKSDYGLGNGKGADFGQVASLIKGGDAEILTVLSTKPADHIMWGNNNTRIYNNCLYVLSTMKDPATITVRHIP